MAYANNVSKYKPLRKGEIFIPKKLWHVKTKRFLSFREQIESRIEAFDRTAQYATAGIKLIDNTSDEILALAKELNERLDGTWVVPEEDEQLQKQFRAIWPPGDFCYGFPSSIGSEFLRDNTYSLE